MIKTSLSSTAAALALVLASQAHSSELTKVDTVSYKQSMTQTLVQKLQDPAYKQELIKQLRNSKEPVLYSNALGQDVSLKSQSVLDQTLAQGIYPELWLHKPNGQAEVQLDKVLIAYAPQGEEANWQYIPAINPTTGEQLQLDVEQAPDVPVIVVETHGQYSMQNFIQELNTQLNVPTNLSLQSTMSSSGTVETTKLTKISLQDDEEPWIKGDAEIFTFVAGVFDNNQPAIKAVGLPYLDDEDTNYYPNQLIINWNDYRYNAVNFSMYEEDSETNYKQLSKVIVTAVGAIGSLAGFEPAIAIAEITNRIQDAMPDSWYTDDHDYVDTCYTLVKGESLNDHWCARGNARISTRPFTLRSN